MLIDITQELFHCRVYPGDPQPERIRLLSLENGDSCNLTGLRMCAHNGTHVDAPRLDLKQVPLPPLSLFHIRTLFSTVGRFLYYAPSFSVSS